MTRRTRRIIFLLCVLTFLIVTPGVLLYASGYLFDWEKNALIKTGSFYFDSLPKEAKIFIDDEPKNATPLYIGRLLPKSYAIKISKDGYFDWHKNLEILPQVATEARSVYLAPKEPKITKIADNVTSSLQYFLNGEKINPQQILQNATSTIEKFDFQAQNIAGAQFSPDNEKLLFWTNNEIWVLWLEDVWSQPYRKISEKELITRLSDQILEATWFLPTNEHIIYAVKSDGQTQIKLTELDGRGQRNTYDIYSGNISEIYLNPNDNLLYILAKEKIHSLELIKK